MHHGADTTDRLSRVLRVLRAYSAGITTAELQSWTGSMAPATDISELRQNGHLIECRCEGKNERGRRVYRYTYKGKA